MKQWCAQVALSKPWGRGKRWGVTVTPGGGGRHVAKRGGLNRERWLATLRQKKSATHDTRECPATRNNVLDSFGTRQNRDPGH